MKTGRTWVVYTLIRIGIFAVVLALLLVTQMTPWIAAVIAAVISLCASYIFLRKPREQLASGLYEARHGTGKPAPRAADKPGSDEDLEDTVVDHAVVDHGGDSHVGDAAAPSPVVGEAGHPVAGDSPKA